MNLMHDLLFYVTVRMVRAYLFSGIAHGLNYEGDGAVFDIRINDGERYALAIVATAHYDEVACPSGFGYEGSFDNELCDFFAELLFADYSVHIEC